VIPTAFEYVRAASLDEAVAKLKAANGGGKFIAGGHSLVPLMKLRLSEPKVLIDIARIPGLAGIGERDGRITIGAGTKLITMLPRPGCCRNAAPRSPTRPRASAIRRYATAARSAEASRTPIRRPTTLP